MSKQERQSQLFQKIWMFDDPRSYGARAILRWAAEGLRIVGKSVRVAPFDPAKPNQAQRLREDLLRFEPDAALLANHPAALFLHQIELKTPPCRFLVWLLDDPLIMGGEAFGEDEIALVSDPAFADGARTRGAKSVVFLPVAAPDTIEGAAQSNYAAPVAYVGATARPDEMRAQLPAETAAYFDRIAAKKAEDPTRTFAELLEDDPIAPGKQVKLTGQVAYYLYAESNRISRVRHLFPLADMGLALYGNDAWRPQIAHTPLERCFRGGIDPIHDYPKLIQSVDINLNLRSLQGFSAPTHRDFLAPRLGAFMLSTQRHGALVEQVQRDGDLFSLQQFPWSPEAASPETLREAVIRYGENPSLRREWVEYAAADIVERHLFSRRMRQLETILEEVV